MKRWLRRIGIGLLALVTLACLALASIYVASEPQLRKTYEVAGRTVAVPDDPESVAEGRRLATIRGCNDGCHGKGVAGGELWDEPWVVKIIAPDLTRVAASHSDADLGRIIAFLRSLPVGSGPDTKVMLGPLGRLQLMANPEWAYAEEIAADAPWLSEAELAGEQNRGRYLAITVCSECHGMELKGDDSGLTPDLAIAVAYTEQQFKHLMRTGEPVGGRKLGLMAEAAQVRFSQFTDDEVHVLYDYLQYRARGQP